MATSDISSTQLTNRDATPRVVSNSIIQKGAMQVSCGTVEALTADAIASIYRMVSVPSNARVAQVLLSCDDLGSTGLADVGVYQTTANGGAVVDADHFASAQALTTALKNSDVTHGSAVYGLEDIEKPLWAALGLSADSKRDYDICLTLTEAIIAAGTISMQVYYVI